MTTTKRAVVAIASGSAGGQLIALACSPLISRLVPPGEFGPFAVVSAVTMPLASIAALRLEAAIPLPKEDAEAIDLARAALIAVMGFAVLFIPATLLWGDLVARSLRLVASPILLVWAPLIAALMGVFVVLSQLAIRFRLYGAMGRRNLLQAACTAISQVLFGYLGWGSHGLAAGFALGQLIGVCSLLLDVQRAFNGKRDRSCGALRVVQRYKQFPLVMLPSALINALGLQAPVLLFSSIYGPEASGLMGMTQRILTIPLALIGAAIAQVFLGEFSSANRVEGMNLMNLFLGTTKRLSALALLLLVSVYFLGPPLFEQFLGEQWIRSGDYAKALAIGVALQMVASPLSQTLIVLRRLRAQLTWDVLRLALCCTSIYGAKWAGSTDRQAAGCLGLAMALSYLVLWLLSWRAVAGAVTGASVSASAK